jgi:hypothetical protein
MQIFKAHQEYRLDFIKDHAKKENLFLNEVFSHFSKTSHETKLSRKPTLELLDFNLVKIYEFKCSNFTDTSNWKCIFASNEFSEFDNEFSFWF